MRTRVVLPVVLVGAAALLGALGLLGVHFTFYWTKGHPEPKAERSYRDVVTRDFRALRPLNKGLNVCNIGGTVRGCYDASNDMIEGLNTLLHDLDTTYVPSRYVDAHKGVRRGVTHLIEGYRTRNRGLATNSNGLFVSGNEELKSADGEIRDAWERFPPDARPNP